MFILFIIFLSVTTAYYLTTNQKVYIKNILQNKSVNDSIKMKVKRILVDKYSWWAIGQARIFQQKYKIRSDYIRNAELIQSALYGLSKSMNCYDGSVEIPYYSCFYIKNELYRCLTNRQPFGRYKHHQLMKDKIKPIQNTRVEPMSDERLYIEKTQYSYSNTYDHLQEYIYNKLNQLQPVDKRIFLYRFDIHTLKIKFTLHKIAQLMDLSYETIKISLNRSKQMMQKNI